MFMDMQDTKRILREIYILRKLNCPNIVHLRNVFPSPKFDTDHTMYVYNSFFSRYIVMDYMETDMYKVIASNQFFEVDHIRYILYQLLCGLLYIHSAGVIHRDLKPANILLNEVYLSSFYNHRMFPSKFVILVSPEISRNSPKRKLQTFTLQVMNVLLYGGLLHIM